MHFCLLFMLSLWYEHNCHHHKLPNIHHSIVPQTEWTAVFVQNAMNHLPVYYHSIHVATSGLLNYKDIHMSCCV